MKKLATLPPKEQMWNRVKWAKTTIQGSENEPLANIKLGSFNETLWTCDENSGGSLWPSGLSSSPASSPPQADSQCNQGGLALNQQLCGQGRWLDLEGKKKQCPVMQVSLVASSEGNRCGRLTALITRSGVVVGTSNRMADWPETL